MYYFIDVSIILYIYTHMYACTHVIPCLLHMHRPSWFNRLPHPTSSPMNETWAPNKQHTW